MKEVSAEHDQHSMADVFAALGLTFPQTLEQLANFDRVYADYDFQSDETLIDPEKILERVRQKHVAGEM